MLAADAEAAAAAEPDGAVRLLPAFDHYVVAAPRGRRRRRPRRRARAGLPAAGLAVAGAGWSTAASPACGRTSPQGDRLVVEVEPFTKLSRAEKAGVEAEAEALARFLGGELELSLS